MKYYKVRAGKKTYTARGRANHAENQRRRYARLVAAGLCTGDGCGGIGKLVTLRYCQGCLDQKSAARRAQRAARLAAGLCAKCDHPRELGYATFCRRHRLADLKSDRANRERRAAT